MRIFSWLTGRKDHHVHVTRGRRGKYWWSIVRQDEDAERTVAVSVPPGHKTFEEAETNVRDFLKGTGAKVEDIIEGGHD